MTPLKRCYRAYVHALGYGQPAFLRIVRLLIGRGFFLAGSGKLAHPDVAAKKFAEFGVPMPAVNIYVAGTAETVCGFLLILGAASRLITLPLIGSMIVAYAIAHKDVFDGMWADPSGFVQAFVSAPAFPYLAVVLVVLLSGPGQGHCATAKAHSCQGQNDCKGQGGCGEHPGENACKGQGACTAPLDAGKKMTWQKARKHFEELMTEAKKKFGDAPAS